MSTLLVRCLKPPPHERVGNTQDEHAKHDGACNVPLESHGYSKGNQNGDEHARQMESPNPAKGPINEAFTLLIISASITAPAYSQDPVLGHGARPQDLGPGVVIIRLLQYLGQILDYGPEGCLAQAIGEIYVNIAGEILLHLARIAVDSQRRILCT